MKDIKGDLDSINNRLTKIEIKMESEVKDKLDLLCETQVDTNRRLDLLEKKMDELTEKVNQHDLKIKVIEGGKKNAENELGKAFWSLTGWTKRDDIWVYSRNI